MSRVEVARATKIPLQYLRALEEDDYRLVPDEAYLTRFVSDYSRFLGLDPLPVAELFQAQLEKVSSGPGRFLTLSPRPYVMSLRLLVGVGAAGGMGVVLLFLVFSFLTNREIPPLSREDRPSSPPREVLTRESPPRPPLPPPPVTSGGRQILTVRAEQATWIALRVDGGAVHEVLMRAGETVNWEARREFRLTVGNAGGVTVSLNGHPLPPLGPPGQVVRDVVLPSPGPSPPGAS